MWPSRRFLACAFLLQGAGLILASPLLHERENHYHLKCTNAPTVTAGYYLDPRLAIPPTNATATCQAEYAHLHCVPGTRTYLFFGTLAPTSPNQTLYATALTASIAYVRSVITDPNYGDGPIPRGVQYITSSDNPVQIYAQDAAPAHHLTWGVLGAALRGLEAWMGAVGYADATFQVNDGGNWVGSGYVGVVDAEERCVFGNARVEGTLCTATDEEGDVYGPDHGRFCDF